MSIDLYKSKGVHSNEYRQSERRHALLELQQKHRNESVDQHRSIEPLKKVWKKFISRRHHHHRSSQYNDKYPAIKNQIMLSEWLKEVPDDIENWFIKPCPKGVRVLVIANDGVTRVFNKYGAFMRQFHTEFPGDSRNRHNSMTILDCIHVSELDEYFIIDALAYGSQALTDCEAEFRFFWLESQHNESNFEQISEHHEYPFRVVEKVSCNDELALNQLFAKFPIWPNNQPELDGFLFYHKEASYVHGKTPLVGWLFAFMIPELFNVPCFNENYINEKPANYSNYITYMEQFDDELCKKRRMRRNKIHDDEHRMDEEQQSIEEINDINDDTDFDQTDPNTILKETMDLEINSGNDMEGKPYQPINVN